MATRKSELVITCNAKAVKDVFEYLNRQLADVKQKLKDLNAKGEKSGWTEQMKKDFRDLTKQATAIDSAIIHNQQSMVKYGQVLKDLSGSKLKDLKSALREATTSLNKMSEKSPGREKLINDIKRIKDQISGTSGLTMSFRQAQTQLKNLDGTSMEKLKQGLAAIKAQLDNPNIGNKWRRSLEQMQQQYQAAMAVRTAPTGVMPVTKMNAQQLGAERTALMSAIAATSGVKGYEGKTAGMEQRLKAVNEQLKLLTDNEKKADQAAKQLQATQEAAQTVRAVYRGQAVELEKLQAAYKTLQARQQQFAGTNDAKARATAQQMAMLKNRIDQVTASMQAEIKIDKQFLRTATNQQLQNALTQLQQKLQSLNSTQSKAAQKLKADMKAVETQIKNNTGAIRQQGNTFGTAIKNIAAYVGVFGAFNMIKSKITEVYKSNLKLSDSLADIRKVSGLTTEEINKLYTNISKIDSRNTIETLNKLAYTGAKLGIGQNYGVEGLTGFVRAAEQVQMALGEDLGEEALPALAKLTEVMNLIPRYGVEQAMQKSASAIFQLGATSTATGKNIVEFSKRLMGLANVSRVSADELLAIGSAADAMGLMPEVAATAFNKLFTSIQKGHNMIEKSLGLVKGSINENFSQGKTMQSIIDIFEAMNKRGNMNALDGIFKDLGSDGARLVAVMTTMADRVDILKKHLATSTQAFKEGTAVINEYMIQNETANALMQRASNLWSKAFTNPEGIDMVKQLAEQWYEVSKALTQSESSMYVFHSSLEKITNTVVSLIQILPFLIKMLTWMAVFGGIRMLANSFAALVVSINAARTATASLQVLMNSNWVLAGISAVVAGVSLFVDKMNAAAEAAERAQKRQAELDAQLVKSKEKIEMVAAPLESYKKALDGSNKSLDERNRLLKDLLKSDYQQYLDYLGIEIDGAIDLAKAYAMVVKVLKQKKAYEEREQFRDEINSTNKYDRMRAGMQFGQAAKAIGAENIDQEWLRRKLVVNQPIESIIQDVIKKAGGTSKTTNIGRGVQGISLYDKNGNLIDSKAIDRLRKTITEYNTSRVAENANDKLVDEQYKDLVGDFDNEKFQEEIIKAQLKRKGSLEKLKPDKDAIAAAKKAAQDAKAAARKELKDAETETNAIIAKVEEWYTLQQNVITESYNDGKITEQQMTSVNQQLEQAKNTALAAARRSLSGQDTQTWQKVKTDMDALMLDQGEWSRELLDAIVNTDMTALRNALMKFDGKKSLEQWGFTSTAFRDGLNKNAAKNEAKVREIDAKAKKQVETFLLQYDFINQAYKSFSDQLVNLGILTETAQQMAKKMADADNPDVLYSQKDFRADQQRQEQSRRDALTAFLKQGSRPYSVDMNNAGQLQDWLRELTGAEFNGIGAQGMELKFHSWAEAFRDDFTLWIKDADKYKTSIQEFFMSLMTAEDNYYKKRKEAYNNAKTHLDQSMQAAGWTDQYDEAQTELSGISSLRKITGEGENLWQQHGLQDTIAEDPEIKAIQLRIAMRQKEFEEAKALGESQQLIAKKQNEVLAAQADLAEQVGNSIANRISHLRELSAPLEEFGEDVGQKLGDALFGLQSTSDTWNQITKKMILSVSKMTLQMASQYLQQKLQQALTNKAIEAQEMMHQATMQSIAIAGGTARVAAEQVTNTQLLTATEIADRLRISKEARVAAIMAAFGVSEGAAKTIAALGFWGIPLIGVITSVLMGLLSSALSTAGSESESSASSTATAPKTKLVSGMLTYDRGNVDKFAGRRKLYDDGETQVYGRRRYLGEDGKVYTATAEPAPKDGLVTHPIATTVQGQPALVAENGPEIVIGRETTKAIMMNEPELIKYLANYQQHGGSQGYSTARGLAAYDSGNVQSVAGTQPSDISHQTSDAAAERQALINRLDRSDALMEQVLYFLQNPVPPEIAMYDTGGKKGLRSKMHEADRFMARYGG